MGNYASQIASLYAPKEPEQLASVAPPNASVLPANALSPVYGPPTARLGPGADPDWQASVASARDEELALHNAEIDRQNNEALNRERNAALKKEADFAAKVYTNRYIVDQKQKRLDRSDPEWRKLTELEQAKIADGIARGMSAEDAADFAAGKIPDKDLPKPAPIGDLPLAPKATEAVTQPAAQAPPAQPGAATTPAQLAAPAQLEGSTFADSGAAATSAKPQPPAGAGGMPAGAGAGGARAGGGASASMGLGSTVAGGGDFDSPYAMAAGGLQQEAEAKKQLAQIEGMHAVEQVKAGDKAQQELERLNEQYKARSEAYLSHLEDMTNEAAAGKVDPDHWWHSQSTGQQILYGLAAAIGGFGAGFNRTPNYALDMIKSKISADIEAQRDNLLNKHKSIENQKGLLAEAYKRTHSMEEATMLAKSVAYERLAAQAKALGVGAQGTLAEGEAMQKLSTIDQWRQKMKEEAAQFIYSEQEKLLLHRQKGGAGGASEKEVEGLAKALEAKNIEPTEAALDRVTADLSEPDPAGFGPVKSWLKDHAAWALSERGRQNNTDVDDALDQYTKSMGKFAPGAVKQVQQLVRGGTPEGIRHAIGVMKETTERHRRAIESGYPAQVRAELAKRRGQTEGTDAPTGSSVPMMPLTGGK